MNECISQCTLQKVITSTLKPRGFDRFYVVRNPARGLKPTRADGTTLHHGGGGAVFSKKYSSDSRSKLREYTLLRPIQATGENCVLQEL